MMNNQEWNRNSNSNSSSLVDVSSFLLFESTGDSEFDSNIFSTSDDPMDSLNHFLEDDDAQSCSYDNEDIELGFKIENDDDDDDDDEEEVNIYSRCYSSGFHRKSIGWNSNMEDDDEDEGGVVEQRSMNNNGVNRCNEKLKSNVCSSVVVDCELKSQKDKDKLFWETCLAS